MHFINCVKTLILIDAFHAIFRHKFCAYLDPGTGSIILQVIIAGLCGGLFAIKLFWRQFKTFFKNLFSKSSKVEKK